MLLAHLAEHTRAVNQLAVLQASYSARLRQLPASACSAERMQLTQEGLQGGAFFVSASNDGTCRVWDCRRLERDVSFRSRLTFSPQVIPR